MRDPEVDPPIVPAAPPLARGRSHWARGMACVAMIPLLGFIGQTGQTLWGEWALLREDQAGERERAFVGYVDINPNPNFAARPPDWLHDEGADTLLWAGWKEKEHHWFRFGRGEIDARALSSPIGRDAIQAIDYPLYEQDGGPRWGRVPPEAPVVGFGEGEAATAYPMKVLDKVQVINDQVGDRPILVACLPDISVSIFEATLDGRRVIMGHSGYFTSSKTPVLYDRGTQSLWSEGEGGIVAIAGRRKGFRLKLVAKLDVVPWSEWRSNHPAGRLLIGADRSKTPSAD